MLPSTLEDRYSDRTVVDLNAARLASSGVVHQELLRPSFRKRHGIALVVSNVVGVGIFTTPALVATLVPDPVAMLALWLVGGALALAGAASYASLAELWPTAGGEYVYLSRSYGPLAGFLSGWTSLIAGFSGSIAASAVAVGTFAGQYFPALASNTIVTSRHIGGITLTLSTGTLLAAAIIALFGLLHACSLFLGKVTQNALATLVVGLLGTFVVFGLHSGRGSWSAIHSQLTHVTPWNLLLAMVPVMFTYSGWNAAAYVSEEIHASRRSMRPVLLSGTAIVISMYVALNALYVYAVPMKLIASSPNVADVAAQSLFHGAAGFVTPVVIIALLGNISAMTIAGPRVYFSMARDRVFFPVFARTDSRFATPLAAIGLQTAWAMILVLVAEFDQILMYTGFALVLSSGAAVAGLFRVYAKSKSARTCQRRTLVFPAVFVLASAAMVLNMILNSPKVALVGLVLILAGVPLYAYCRRRGAAFAVGETWRRADD